MMQPQPNNFHLGRYLIFTIVLTMMVSCTLPTKKNSQNTAVIEQKLIVAPTELKKQTTSPKKLIPTAKIAIPSLPKTYQDVWLEIADHAELGKQNVENYKSYVNYYRKHPKHIKDVSKRANPYLHFILQEVKKRDMPYEIALLPFIESAFHPFAKSYISATGLWQFMPSTGHMFGLYRDWWYEGRQDIYTSTHAALNYLQKLYKQNNNDWLLALASYNGGYGNVLKAKKKFLKKHPSRKPTYWSIRKYLPVETQNYVPQFLAISHLLENQKQYGLNFYPITNKPFFSELTLTQQLDINKLAQKTKVDLKTLKKLNPGFLRLATPPTGDYKLLLPVKTASEFKEKIAKQPDLFKVNWARHTIKSGESLSVIAEKYRTTSREIKKLNQLKSNRIRTGKNLLIPVSNETAKELIKQSVNKDYKGNKHFHTVKKGDSLWKIAKYYNVSSRKLCEWNRISIKDPLRKGQKLEIRSNKYGKHISYTLKNGDSLWRIANRYSVSIIDLSHWNNIKKTKILQPGTKISIWIKG